MATNTYVCPANCTSAAETRDGQLFRRPDQQQRAGHGQIDTNPPVITAVAAATNVGSAVVTWDTSEAADSLVQYGGGTILDHTAL